MTHTFAMPRRNAPDFSVDRAAPLSTPSPSLAAAPVTVFPSCSRPPPQTHTECHVLCPSPPPSAHPLSCLSIYASVLCPRSWIWGVPAAAAGSGDTMSSTLLWGSFGVLVPLMANSLRKLPLMRRTFFIVFFFCC